MIKIQQTDEFYIHGRGLVFTVDLERNNLPLTKPEFLKKLMGQEVEVNKIGYIVKGVESFAMGEQYEHKSVGILVKPIRSDDKTS